MSYWYYYLKTNKQWAKTLDDETNYFIIFQAFVTISQWELKRYKWAWNKSIKNLFIFARIDYCVPGWRKKWLALGNISCLDFPGTGNRLPALGELSREKRAGWGPRPRCVLAWLRTQRCPPAIWPAAPAAALALSSAWTALSPDLHTTEKFRST